MVMDKDNFLNRVRLRHIQCFVAVAQTQNLGRAAERLSLSQPAVSKTITELETLVGSVLVERGRFGARLTPEGEVFLAHAVTVLDALDGGRRALSKSGAALQGSLVVGALPTVAPDVLPAALIEFRRQFPEVKVEVDVAVNSQLLERLKAGDIDVAVGRMADPQMMIGVSFELLYVEPLVAVVRDGHPLANNVDASLPGDVVSYPLVVSTRGTVPRHRIENYLKARGLDMPDHTLETLSVPVSRGVVLGSDAVWFTPVGAVRDDLSRGLLRALPLSLEGTEEPVGLMLPTEKPLSGYGQGLVKLLRSTNRSRSVP